MTEKLYSYYIETEEETPRYLYDYRSAKFLFMKDRYTYGPFEENKVPNIYYRYEATRIATKKKLPPIKLIKMEYTAVCDQVVDDIPEREIKFQEIAHTFRKYFAGKGGTADRLGYLYRDFADDEKYEAIKDFEVFAIFKYNTTIPEYDPANVKMTRYAFTLFRDENVLTEMVLQSDSELFEFVYNAKTKTYHKDYTLKYRRY